MTKHLFIVGAGFSYNAGLPLASNFVEALMDNAKLNPDGPSVRITRFLEEFVAETFGNGRPVDIEQWPVLEDIFTLVDLSANTGHHLGGYSASELRVVRRALIVRIIRMLEQKAARRKKNPTDSSRLLRTFHRDLNVEETAVLSMNWDTVVERGLATRPEEISIDYACDQADALFQHGQVVLTEPPDGLRFKLLKPHGSVNWLYCDACRGVLALPPSQYEHVAQTIFREQDWRATHAGSDPPSVKSPRCPICGTVALGTRFATFSYKKALEFPMHAASWRSAERLLRDADDWVFFGYSMPPADFDFKHLLKRVQLSRRARPRIVVITGGNAARQTSAVFQNFFGDGEDDVYFEGGLTPRVMSELRTMGALYPERE